MKGIAKSFYIFSGVMNEDVLVNAAQVGEDLTASFFTTCRDRLVMISLKQVTVGYYSISYNVVSDIGAEHENQISQDYSLPFPAYCAPGFLAEIVNDVFNA